KLMSADDPVPPLLEQHHRPAKNLIVPAADDFLYLVHVPQQRIGAKKRRKAGTAHGADEGDGLRPPPFEGARDGLEVEKIDGGVGAALQLRVSEAAERHYTHLLSRPLEMIHELDGKLPGPGENRDWACG